MACNEEMKRYYCDAGYYIFNNSTTTTTTAKNFQSIHLIILKNSSFNVVAAYKN